MQQESCVGVFVGARVRMYGAASNTPRLSLQRHSYQRCDQDCQVELADKRFSNS